MTATVGKTPRLPAPEGLAIKQQTSCNSRCKQRPRALIIMLYPLSAPPGPLRSPATAQQITTTSGEATLAWRSTERCKVQRLCAGAWRGPGAPGRRSTASSAPHRHARARNSPERNVRITGNRRRALRTQMDLACPPLRSTDTRHDCTAARLRACCSRPGDAVLAGSIDELATSADMLCAVQSTSQTPP